MDELELYEQTGTLAPLINNQEYNNDEKVVLLHFFTNVDKNVYCATDAMSSQLWAFLVGQYSRSSLSMRDRFLKLIADSEKAFKQGKIKEEEHISLKDLANSIRNNQGIKIKYFNDRAASFLKKWGVDYGHNSLKDADKIRFAVENVSEVFTKIIEAPFPCLGDFQEKSTRYLAFGKENIIYSPILLQSKFKDRYIELNEKLIETYEKYLPIVKEVLIANKIIEKKHFAREAAFENTLNAKAFDIVRYLLPSGVATSLGTGLSTRTCESHISEMLSHPIKEARLIAKTMHEEALKISPGLLSHVAENEYLKNKREASRKIANEIFYKKEITNDDIKKGLDNAERVKLISADNIDNIIVASILFESSRTKGISYFDCLNRVELMSNDMKEKILNAEIGSKGKFDRMPRTIQHGRIIFEFFTDFGAYRDYQRHRASPQIWQGVTAIHGYDYPEYIDLHGMEEFKKDYDEIMTKVSKFARAIITEYPDESEYVAALGHLVRTTFEMHPGQLAYVCELRTTPQGHHSYRELFQKVYEIMEDKAPLYIKHLKISQNLETSRQKQEERAAEKREKLGIN